MALVADAEQLGELLALRRLVELAGVFRPAHPAARRPPMGYNP